MKKYISSVKLRSCIPVAVFVLGVLPRIVGIELPVADSFHVGEWFASAVTLLNKPEESPLTIHGGWDFAPAILMKSLAGDDNYFFPTIYLVDKLIPVLAALLFFRLLSRLLVNKTNWPHTIFLSASALAAPALVGTRDLLLVCTCLSLHDLLSVKGGCPSYTSRAFLIISTSIGSVWSFDRGIAGLALVTVSLTSAAFIEHDYKYLKILLLSISTAVLTIYLIQSIGAIDYMLNIDFLLKTSKQWRHEVSLGTFLFSALAILCVLVAIFTTVRMKMDDRIMVYNPYWIGISICSLIMLRAALNRPAIQTALMAMWLPMILSAYSISGQKVLPTNKIIAFATAPIVLFSFNYLIFPATSAKSIFALFCAFSLLTAISLIISNRFNNIIDSKFTIRYALIFVSLWIIALLIAGPARDLVYTLKSVSQAKTITPFEFLAKGVPFSRIADKGNKWAVNQILESGSKCLLDMSNSGIINAGVDLPTCTKFSYPVYATKAYEKAILHQLKIMKPNTIVYSTTNWQYSIDGKGMRDRFPKLDSYLLQAYPFEQCKHNYCIRSSVHRDFAPAEAKS
jgi:hypothetical protein